MPKKSKKAPMTEAERDDFYSRRNDLRDWLDKGARKFSADGIDCIVVYKYELTQSGTNGVITWEEINDLHRTAFHADENVWDFWNQMTVKHIRIHWTVGA